MRLPFGGNRRSQQVGDSPESEEPGYSGDALSTEYDLAPSPDISDSDADMAEAIVAARRTEFAALSDLNDKANWSDVA